MAGITPKAQWPFGELAHYGSEPSEINFAHSLRWHAIHNSAEIVLTTSEDTIGPIHMRHLVVYKIVLKPFHVQHKLSMAPSDNTIVRSYISHRGEGTQET